MCGLLYAFKQNGQSASKTVLKRFQQQKDRGTQGFGYITIKDGKIGEVARFEKEKSMIESLEKEKANEILFHHRIPTGTPNFIDMTHPIVVKNKILKRNYYVIHNGMISNDLELKMEHERLGFNYTTDMVKKTTYQTKNFDITEKEEHLFNDSEVLAIDLALMLEDKQTEMRSKGSIAFICFETDKRNNIKKIHYGHNTQNPLVLEDNKDLFVLKSEGSGLQVNTDVLITIDYKTKKITQNNMDIGLKAPITSYQNGRYDRESELDDDEWERQYEYGRLAGSVGSKEHNTAEHYYQSLQEEVEDLERKKKEIKLEMTNVRNSIESGVVDETDFEVSNFFETAETQLEDIIDSIDELEKEIELNMSF